MIKKLKLFITANDILNILIFLLFIVIAIFAVVVFRQIGNSKDFNFIVIWALIFGGIPLYALIHKIKEILNRSTAMRLGNLYQAKVVNYKEDWSQTISGKPVKDIIVAFYKNGFPQLEYIDVNIKNRGKYPIGSIVDIYEYDGEYIIGSEAYDGSIRNSEELDNFVKYRLPSYRPMVNTNEYHVEGS